MADIMYALFQWCPGLFLKGHCPVEASVLELKSAGRWPSRCRIEHPGLNLSLQWSLLFLLWSKSRKYIDAKAISSRRLLKCGCASIKKLNSFGFHCSKSFRKLFRTLLIFNNALNLGGKQTVYNSFNCSSPKPKAVTIDIQTVTNIILLYYIIVNDFLTIYNIMLTLHQRRLFPNWIME